MSEHEPIDPGDQARTRFLTPAVSAVAAFTLAVLALMGQNALTVAVSALVEMVMGQQAYFVGWGLTIAVQAGVVVWLARRAFDAREAWVAVLGRAAVVVVAVAAAAGVLLVLGGTFRGLAGY